MASSSPVDLRYAPETNSAIRRSKYLEDALAQLQEAGSRPITGGWGELAARLGATYLTKKGKDKADSALAEALAKEAEGRKASILAPFGLGGGGLTDQGVQSAPQGPLSPQTGAPQAPSPIASAMMPPQAQSSPAGQVTPQKPQGGSIIDALMPGLIKRESGGRPRPGPMTPYGQAQGQTQMLDATAEAMAKKTGVPWRPEMMRGTSPEAMQYQEALGRAYLQEGLETTGNPRDALRYYHGGPDRSIWGPKTNAYADAILAGVPEAQLIGGPAPQGQMQVSGSMAEAQAPAPQMNMNMGFPPMPQSPQPPAGGPPAPQGAPAQSLPGGAGAWGPAPGEIAYLQQLASSPRTIDAAEAYANELRKKYASPPKMETYNANGVPVAYNPYAAQPGALPIPQGAMNQTTTGGQLRLPGDPNAAYSVNPYGKVDPVAQAPQGYNYGPNGSLSPQSGGPADPYRVQAPPAGYRLGSQGMEAIPGGPSDPTQGGNLIEGEAKLRREYDTAMQTYRDAKAGYSKVVAAAKDGTGASDIALIFGFMKTLDPTSTVREGEFATAQNSGSIDQTIANLYNKALEGERLQPEQRAQFANTAAQQFATYEERARENNERFMGLAKAYGFDPSRVIQPFTPVEPFAPQQQGAAPPQARVPPGREDIEREMRRRKLIP